MSKRRRPRPASSTKFATARNAPPSSSAMELSAVNDTAHEAHRLATIEIDSGGSVGSALRLFKQAAAKVAEHPARRAPLSPDAMRARAARIRREVAAAEALASAAAELRYAEEKASVLRWRLQRSIQSEKRRLERDRRREEGGLYANQQRSDGRPTRMAIDPEACEFLKAYAVRRRTSVGYLVGRLAADVVSHNALPRIDRDDRCVTQRQIRLIGLDVETWTSFRSMAFDAHVTATRALGAVVEREARRLGWSMPRPDPAL